MKASWENARAMRGKAGGFCGRHPLFAAALVAVACVAAAELRFGWVWPLAILLAALGGWLRGPKTALAWLACGMAAAIVLHVRTTGRKSLETRLLGSPGGVRTARLLEDPRGGGILWNATARLRGGPDDGAKILWQGRGGPAVAGSLVRAAGDFAPLPEPRNPGEFDQASWLRNRGVAAAFVARGSDCDVFTGPWAAGGAGVRRYFRRAVTLGLAENSEEAAVIRAVVIGERPPDADLLIAAFRNSGTLHAFSVSGLHVAMVGGIGWMLLRLLGVPRRWAVPVLLPLIFGYSWLTGNNPPAVRSAWMAAVFLGAFTARRRPDLLNALGAVLLIALLWDGRLLFQPGVQLSYGVVAAIAAGAALAGRLFDWLARPPLYLPQTRMNFRQRAWLRFRQNLAGSLGVSLAAGVGSAPLTVWHFGLLTPVSVLAGLVLVPLVFVLLFLALAGVAFQSAVPPVAEWIGMTNGRVARAAAFSAETFASIPGGHFQIRPDREPFLLVYDLERGAGAACFAGRSGSSVLIDCGDPYRFKRLIAPSLCRLGVAPDSVILTHPDGHHLGGGSAVWRRLPIRQALLPVARARSVAYREWLELAPRAGISTIQAGKCGGLPLPDGARLEIVRVPNPNAASVPADDRVAIYRLRWRGWKILFTSDAGSAAEREMLDAGIDLRADVIVAGRHRTDVSLCDAFLDAVSPRAIVISNHPFPECERLAPETAAWWRSRGIRVCDQGRAGAVTLHVDSEGNLRLDGFADRSATVLTRRGG
jgi:ComEC/Rec2-related protein